MTKICDKFICNKYSGIIFSKLTFFNILRPFSLKKLIYSQDKPFEIFAFGMKNVDRMVSGLMQLVQNPDITAGSGGGGEHRHPELLLGNHLGA